MADIAELQLSREPDGYGFFYGTVEDLSGEIHQVNIMPPAHKWVGQMKLEGYEPDLCDWSIYLNGELFAKVKKLEQIEHKIASYLG